MDSTHNQESKTPSAQEHRHQVSTFACQVLSDPMLFFHLKSQLDSWRNIFQKRNYTVNTVPCFIFELNYLCKRSCILVKLEQFNNISLYLRIIILEFVFFFYSGFQVFAVTEVAAMDISYILNWQKFVR